MILFFSDGRLGNQFFQYSFLKSIARGNETIFVTNMCLFEQACNISNKNFKNFAINKYLSFIVRVFVKPYILMLLVKLKLISYICQDKYDGSILPTVSSSKGLLPITLVETDFFQSEKLFDSSKIDFELKSIYYKRAEKILSNLPNDLPMVFLHVRRGDYLTEIYNGSRGINLPNSYYIKALEMIKIDLDDFFCIFLTDDYEYVECCFKDVKNKYISKEDMFTDLALMSKCNYGVVSNSSFSWWGAYLMDNPRSVIFPKYWYGWKFKKDSHIDIQPKWAKVIDFD